MTRRRTPVGVAGRSLGRCQSFSVNPDTRQVIAVFQGNLVRVYDEEFIADSIIEVAHQAVTSPGDIYEPWYEFLRDVVGGEAMQAAIAAVAVYGPERLPPGLKLRLNG